MILKNRLTKETLDINYDEFRKKFAKDTQAAFESFKKSENLKPYFKLKDYTEQILTKFLVQLIYKFSDILY